MNLSIKLRSHICLKYLFRSKFTKNTVVMYVTYFNTYSQSVRSIIRNLAISCFLDRWKWLLIFQNKLMFTLWNNRFKGKCFYLLLQFYRYTYYYLLEKFVSWPKDIFILEHKKSVIFCFKNAAMPNRIFWWILSYFL